MLRMQIEFLHSLRPSAVVRRVFISRTQFFYHQTLDVRQQNPARNGVGTRTTTTTEKKHVEIVERKVKKKCR